MATAVIAPMYTAFPTDKLLTNTASITVVPTLATGIAASTTTVASVAAGGASGNTTLSPEDADKVKVWTAQYQVQVANNVLFGYYLVYAIAALFALCALLTIPRFLARLYASIHPNRTPPKHDSSRPNYAFEAGLHQKMRSVETGARVVSGGDLFTGWFLRKGRPGSVGRRAAGDSPYACSNCTDMVPGTTRSHLSPPPHVNPIVSRLPFGWIWTSSPFVNMPWFLYTSAETRMLAIVAAYLAFCIAAMVYKCDLGPQPLKTLMPKGGPGRNYKRSGIIAVTQVPLVIALGIRANIPGLAIGKGYDRIRIVHKVSGRLMFFAGAFHSIGYIVSWANRGVLAKMSTQKLGTTGWLAFIASCVIVITSLPVIRRVAYGLFKASHFLGVIGLLVGLYYHHAYCPPWVIASATIWAFSMLVSFMKTRVADCEIQAVGGATTTLVTIPGITTGWRAGQHVRIRILGLGLLSAECHPFTICNAPDTPGGMKLMVKAAGDWTSRLYAEATSGGHAMEMQAEAGVWKRKARIIVEGPYGGLGNTLPCSFSSVVLVAGGSGISHSLGIAEDLINRSPTGAVATRTIDLVWVIRIEQVARGIMPKLNALVARAKAWEARAIDGRRQGADIALPTALRVHIFVTRAPKNQPLTLITGTRYLGTDEVEKFATDYDFNEGEQKVYAQGYYANQSSPTSPISPSSDGHGAGSFEGYYASTSGHADDYVIRPDLTYANTPAEKQKADWLARNASTRTLRSLQQRQTDCTEPMSSIWAYRGRPDLVGSVSTIVDETIARHGRSITDPRGLFVAACGPEYLVNDARDACQNVAPWKKASVHGIEFDSEFFGL